PAYEEEGGVLGPHHFRKRDRYGPKQNLCRAGVADTDLCVRVAAVPGVGVVLPQSAFDTLKYHLTSAPVLAYPDFHRQFIVDVDASGDGLGAVLSQ
ncbi:hypothetical protein T12_3403, partial [Trichinella patagoniensis]